MLMPDCCASDQFERQMDAGGTERARRDQLGISLHLVVANCLVSFVLASFGT